MVFVDLLGFSIVLPLMPFYADRFGAGDTLIGLLVASYAVAQFFATPLLGRLSDRWGRRPVLLLSVCGSLVGFLLWACAEKVGGSARGALAMLFCSRLLDGFSGGNISVAQAYITDVTTDEKRSQGLGMIGAAFGLGFIIGPPLGGWLSAGGDFALPALVSAGLAFTNLVAIFFFLPESHSQAERGKHSGKRRKVFPVAAIREGLSRPRVGLLLWVSFFYFLAFSTFTSVFSLYTLRRFHLTADGNGILLGFVGVMIVLTQGVLVGRLTRRFGEPQLLRYGVPLLGVSMLWWGLAASLEWLMVVLVLTPICAGTMNVALRSSMTRVVDQEEVGTMLGVQASVESLTRAVGPILGAGLIDFVNAGAPGVFSFATLMLLGLAVGRRLGELPDSRTKVPRYTPPDATRNSSS